jgi:cytochrome c peroxidase
MVMGGALAAILVLGAPAWADDLMKKAQENFKPIPSVVPAMKDNTVTHEKVELGTVLFFDPRLSASEIISCNTCHNLATGGVDTGPTSVGHGWQKGPPRADLKAQAKGPVQAGVEMNATPDHLVKTVASMPNYVELFKKAFPNETAPVTFE